VKPLVLKFGGELLEDRGHLATVVQALARIARSGRPIVVVHGGGKEIDAALKTAGIEKRQVDGLRITDQATLDVVVAVLGGAVNTRLVAALNTAGVAAVGLTGADGRCGLDSAADVRVLDTLTRDGFVPVVACIGLTGDGQLLNVNADTLAGHLAARLGAERLVIAGTTAGVLDGDGATLPALDVEAIAALVGNGTATAGMIAKLGACEQALAGGVDAVVIVDGRDLAALEGAAESAAPLRATLVSSLHEAKR
jgi:acetylglutamate kinase